VKNKLYRFNRWLDSNEVIKFFLLVFFIALFTISLQFGGIVLSLISITALSLFALFRMKIVENVIKFDRSKYDVPSIGEIIIVKKDFFYDGLFRKYINHSDPGQKTNWYKINKGNELLIMNIKETDGDWLISFVDKETGLILDLYYLDTKDYWNTKSNIRNKILSEIGI
jgi:hypothetical protein